MRYTKGHKAETRQRIVDSAARAFRASGVSEVGIGELMRDAGLTHGGFYAHFADKDALVAEACRSGLAQSTASLVSTAASAPAGGELATVIRGYLSRAHRNAPESGCLLPALAGDVARASAEVRDAFTRALRAYLAQLGSLTHASGAETTHDRAIVLASGMAGAILLARAVDDPDLSDRILAACRAFYTAVFATAPDDEATLGG